MRREFFAAVCVGAMGVGASGQLMITDSGVGDRVMLFDSYDGSLLDLNWITDVGAVGWQFTTPKEALAVGKEIWVSDQVADTIVRFDRKRNFLGTITAHPGGGVLDNVRGMGTDGSRVWLTVFHGTPALRGVAVYDTAGNPLQFLPGSGSYFDAQPFNNGLLVTSSTSNSVEFWSTAGVVQAPFATGVVFPQQVSLMSDNSVIAVSSIAAAGVEGVYHFNSDGSLRRFIDTEFAKGQFGELVPRGAHVLGNGNYIITTSIGVFTYDPMLDSFAQVVGGVDAQYINVIPTPGGAALLCVAGLAAARRRRGRRCEDVRGAAEPRRARGAGE